jgi:predicted ATP-binding protein involved in virulence
MRIDKLQLRNFRGYVDHSFEFHPQFNLIIGENASGKTSLLEGLERACASFFLGVGGKDASSIGEDDVRVKPIQQGDTVKLEHQYPVEFLAEGLVRNTPTKWSRALKDKGRRTTREKAKSIQGHAENLVKNVRDGNKVVLPLFSHYGSGRLWVQPKDMRGDPKDDEKLLTSRLDGYRFSNDPRINVADLMRWMKSERYVSLEQGRDRFGFATAKEAMRSCLPECRSLDYSTTEKTLVIELESKGQLPFHLLSDGQRIMLALVADIAFKAAHLNPHLEHRVLLDTPGVVLIDELDLHLHPSWQRHVVADLKKTFPNIQFFATTHSPQVIGETPREEVIVLEGQGTWHHPMQTLGLSSNEVLSRVQDAPVINAETERDFRELDELLDDLDFENARKKIQHIKGRHNGELSATARAEGYMARMELLADAPCVEEDEK